MATLQGMPLLAMFLLAACTPPAPVQLPQPPPNYNLAGALPQPEVVEAVPVNGLSISRLTVNQGAQIEVMRDFEEVEGGAPIVPDKDALIRAHLATHNDWEPRSIRGVLTVQAQDRSFVFEEEIRVDEASWDGDLDTTLDGVVPGAFMQPGVSVVVRLFELDGEARDASEGRSVWPIDGAQELALQTWGGLVPVRLIPVVYTADGSDRRPDTSEEQLELLHDYLVAMYPTSRFELTVDSELVWGEEIGSSFGLNDLLDAIVDEREAREVPAHVYLYALVAPATSRATFCAQGCVAGLSYRPANPNRSWMRSSVGLGYAGGRTAETMAHELGHAHGRRHAPCGNASQIDASYPYEGGLLGSWGWDGVELKPPSSTGDIMGYCTPKWISDYQLAALYERVAAMSGIYGDEARDGEQARWVAEGPNGALTDRGVRRRVLEGGDAVRVKLAVQGESIEATAHHYALDDQPGGAWLLPELGATALTLPDGRWVGLE